MSFDVNKAREHFPSLQRQTAAGMPPVYFDNPAGTQVPRAVIEAVSHYYLTMNANSGGAFATSQRTDAMVEKVRAKMAAFINAPSPHEIVFGPNMTTLNFSLSRALAKRFSPGDEIVLTRMDHDANVAPWLRIAEDHGLTVRWVDIRPEDCTLDMASLEAALSERTKLIATIHAANSVGTINPVAQIAGMAKAVGALHVVDAVQSAPHLPIDVQAIGCDFLLCSAYKFFGPHIGVMWGRYDLLAELPVYKVRPSKDKPPYRWESGTPSFETIAGVGAALDYLVEIGANDSGAHPMVPLVTYEQALVAHLIDVLEHTPGARIYGITDPARLGERVPTVTVDFANHTPDTVAEYLAAQDIYVWSGDYYAVEIMDRLRKGEQGLVKGNRSKNEIKQVM